MNVKKGIIVVLSAVILLLTSYAHAQQKDFRIGLIGLDTSHVIAFTKIINADPDNGFRVVAAYPGGSPDIPDSRDRIEGFTNQLRDEYKLEIVDSIDTLIQKVDGILLESVDGRTHLAQATPVIKAGKPIFIDKPIAASLEDTLRIFDLAKKHNTPCWSSSSLRFCILPFLNKVKKDETFGQIRGCDIFAPCALEPHHPDLFWYGIHGAEMVYTIMGKGCKTVTRTSSEDADLVVGQWNDGRIAAYRGVRNGAYKYEGYVHGTKDSRPIEREGGYDLLIEQILLFFQTGKAPICSGETIELIAFMIAADESKKLQGAPVSIQTVIDKARKNAQKE